MQLIVEHLLNELEPLSIRSIAEGIIGHRESLHFLNLKLLEERSVMDYPYIRQNTIIPIERKIKRANRLLKKYLYNIDEKIAFHIEHHKSYAASDKKAIALALHQLYSTALYTRLSYEPLGDQFDDLLQNRLDRLSTLLLYKNKETIANQLLNLIDSEYITVI